MLDSRIRSFPRDRVVVHFALQSVCAVRATKVSPMFRFTFRDVLWLLSLAFWISPWDSLGAGPAPATSPDIALGRELRHLWPLAKPVYVNREGKVALQV